MSLTSHSTHSWQRSLNMYDLVIRNATIVDGTGKPAFSGDLAVSDGRILAIGDVPQPGKKEIDAGGKLLTPGWVDVHSHMDGQATWDPLCSPAANHGFTTSRTELHTTRDAIAMPGTYADEAELLGIGKAIGELGGQGIYGVVSDWNNWEEEMDWMKRLSLENNCQINFVLFFREEKDWPRVLAQLDFCRQANKEGAQLIPHVGARPVNLLLSWDGTIHPFSFHTNYGALSIMSHEDRLAELKKPEVRAALLAEDAPLMGDYKG